MIKRPLSYLDIVQWYMLNHVTILYNVSKDRNHQPVM